VCIAGIKSCVQLVRVKRDSKKDSKRDSSDRALFFYVPGNFPYTAYVCGNSLFSSGLSQKYHITTRCAKEAK